MIKTRPTINFTIPDLSALTFETDNEQYAHELKVADMVDFNNCGYTWTDAYFLAFGYDTISPYDTYILTAGNTLSEFTGKPVTSHSDYLDVVYAYFEKQETEQQIIAANTPKRGRKAIDPEIAHAKAQEKELNSKAYHAYIDACRERKLKLQELWTDYQIKLDAKKEAEEFHKKAVNEAYTAYLTCKRVTISREDF